MWVKTTDCTSHCVVAIAHGQKWAVGNAATINGEVPKEPSSGCQWYQKGPSGERIAPGNPDFADMSWGRMRPTTTQAESNCPTKNNNQSSMGVGQ